MVFLFILWKVPVLYQVLNGLIVHRLRAVSDTDELDDLVNIAFTFRCLRLTSIRPQQVKEEILALLQLTRESSPKSILEIGTKNGGTLFLFCRVAHPSALIISVDLPAGKFGGGYPSWKSPIYKSFAAKEQKIHLLRADSHEQATLDHVKSLLKGGSLELLFIDGDHTYDGVRKDFEMYTSLMGETGRIVFHDIVPGSLEKVGGVPRFWQEVKSKYNYQEIVKSWSQGGYGIGVITLSARSNDALLKAH